MLFDGIGTLLKNASLKRDETFLSELFESRKLLIGDYWISYQTKSPKSTAGTQN